MPSPWLTTLSWVALALGFGSAAVTLIDITVRGYRQPMKVMQWVWPLTGLYLGPAAVWAYSRWGRPNSHRWLQEHHRDAPPAKPRWGGTSVGVSHCGAGCTLGDIIAEFAIYGLGSPSPDRPSTPNTSATTSSPSRSAWRFNTSLSPRCAA